MVSEHGFSPETSHLFKLKNFNQGSIYCRKLYELGGVALFCKQEHLSSEYNLNSEKDFEMSGISVSTKKNYETNCYRFI